MSQRVILGVSALCVRDRNVLLILRSKRGPAPGRWALPGGKVEEKETLEHALRREVREETGLRVKVGRVAGVAQRPGYVIVCHACEVTGGALKAGDDADAAEWILIDDLSKRRLVPGLLAFLKTAGVKPRASSSVSSRGSRAGRTPPAARGT